MSIYLYWVLNASAVRFNGMTLDERLGLFSSVFGSINNWQPLSLKEVSCIGEPISSDIDAIFRRSRWAMLEDVDHVMEIAMEIADQAQCYAEEKSNLSGSFLYLMNESISLSVE